MGGLSFQDNAHNLLLLCHPWGRILQELEKPLIEFIEVVFTLSAIAKLVQALDLIRAALVVLGKLSIDALPCCIAWVDVVLFAVVLPPELG